MFPVLNTWKWSQVCKIFYNFLLIIIWWRVAMWRWFGFYSCLVVKFATIFLTPPAALLNLSIALYVLLAPICLMAFFKSRLMFSWSRSISRLFPTPPFQLAVEAHLHWCASASERNASFCTILVSISIAYALWQFWSAPIAFCAKWKVDLHLLLSQHL